MPGVRHVRARTIRGAVELSLQLTDDADPLQRAERVSRRDRSRRAAARHDDARRARAADLGPGDHVQPGAGQGRDTPIRAGCATSPSGSCGPRSSACAASAASSCQGGRVREVEILIDPTRARRAPPHAVAARGQARGSRPDRRRRPRVRPAPDAAGRARRAGAGSRARCGDPDRDRPDRPDHARARSPTSSKARGSRRDRARPARRGVAISVARLAGREHDRGRRRASGAASRELRARTRCPPMSSSSRSTTRPSSSTSRSRACATRS